MVESTSSATAALPASPCTSPTRAERSACAGPTVRSARSSRAGGWTWGCRCTAPPWVCSWLCSPGPASWTCGSPKCARGTGSDSRNTQTIRISATASSSESATWGETVTLKTMMATPTAVIVMVWPTPQNAPTRAPAPKRRVRATMVATAITWSGSVACWTPKSRPSSRIGSGRSVTWLAAPAELAHVSVRPQRALHPGPVLALPLVEILRRVLGRLGLGVLQDRLGSRPGHHHDPFLVCHHDVARVHLDPAAGDWQADVTGTVLAPGDRREAVREEREAVGARLAHVADHPVDDEAGHPAPLGHSAHVAARHRHLVVAGLHHDDVAGLGVVDGGVQHQVVVASGAHRIGRARDARDRRPQWADRVAHHRLELEEVGQRGGGERLEPLDHVLGRTLHGELDGRGGFHGSLREFEEEAGATRARDRGGQRPVGQDHVEQREGEADGEGMGEARREPVPRPHGVQKVGER